MANFAGRLRALRTENGWMQKDLAKKVGLSRPAIALYEAGKREPDRKRVEMLADVFGVSTDYLLGRTEVRGPAKMTATSRSDGYDQELPPEAVKFLKEFEVLMRIKYGHKKGPGKAD